ncbi:hypothetical protein KDL01_10000 [Actinospica durhamensis]|uniref:PKD domain-containing protein n=1 Tax=Actinospica durhamensis TaxID=1508375 RepID=A0A941ENF7_9ACTN|nr:hypothetical protein [Actinospica durhamensis]MBR7833598.1 hypothetical protein [Actinospica durhamensis]
MSRMRPRLGAVGLAAAVVGAFAVPQAQAATPATSSGATLFVNNVSSSCTDSGTGTQAAPYCSIQAAADAAAPGDTVSIAGTPGYYAPSYGAVTITKSGTAAAPITFAGTGTTYTRTGSLTIDGSYVEVTGLGAAQSGTSASTGLRVNGSHVTLDGDQTQGTNAPALVFGGSVTADTVSRSDIYEYGSGNVVQIASGDNGVVLTTNQIDNVASGETTTGSDVTVSGAKNTVLTANTIIVPCNTGIAVTGSTGTSIENNVVAGLGGCTTTFTNLSVDSASASSTTVDYNELSQMTDNIAPYSWAGKTYPTPAALKAATGQGAHDEDEQYIDTTTFQMPTGDGVADGNPSAPDELSTDFYGNTWPGAAPDRGAVAIEDFTGTTVQTGAFGQQAGVNIALQGVAWGESDSYSVDWGDGKADVGMSLGDETPGNFNALEDSHMYARPGTYTVTAIIKAGTQTVTKTATVTTTGSTYVPVTPTRVLDTRKGLGAKQAKIGAGATIAVDVTSGVSVPAGLGTVTAVVMNVTAADETGNGVITAYPDGGTLPEASNLNFSTGRNVPNLVTVKVGSDDKVDFHNGSNASTDLLADVAGYYVQGTGGSYYVPNTPKRVLDTRNGTGGTTGAVPAGGTISLSVPTCSQTTSSGTQTATAAAVAMNVTAVAPTANGVVTVYPDGGNVPTASNLNYNKGQNLPNMVVVAVGSDGKVELHNSSAGTVELVADLEGCYSSLGDAFVPLNPVRDLDTRSGLGQGSTTGVPVGAGKNAQYVGTPNGFSDLWNATGVVMNVTVTDAKANGVITAYPIGPNGTLPNASNLNYLKGQTVPNLVMVATDGVTPVNLHNNSTGSVDLIADLFGYFS